MSIKKKSKRDRSPDSSYLPCPSCLNFCCVAVSCCRVISRLRKTFFTLPGSGGSWGWSVGWGPMSRPSNVWNKHARCGGKNDRFPRGGLKFLQRKLSTLWHPKTLACVSRLRPLFPNVPFLSRNIFRCRVPSTYTAETHALFRQLFPDGYRKCQVHFIYTAELGLRPHTMMCSPSCPSYNDSAYEPSLTKLILFNYWN